MSDLYINEDNQSFYASRPESEMTPAGVDAVVDAAAEFPVTGIAFCINVQRALFESAVWETFYGDYDPSAGPEQPAEWRRHGARNLWLLAQRGIDHHARWLARCRHHGIEGWLSMRMNDCHGLKEFMEAEDGKETHWTCHWPSTWWREHPELRRAPYRQERSWEGAFDYSHQIVRDHHMNLVREALERWDMFALELDWLRWGMMFAPGKEQAGLPILTEFMRETKRLAEASAERVGHPVKLAVRVPAEPRTCLALGFDVPRWAEEGLVDMVILSSFLGAANFDHPVAIWRRLLGPKVKLIANAEGVARAHPGGDLAQAGWVESAAFTYGAAAAALQRGVDGIHLFNHCPSKLLPGSETADHLRAVYRNVSDLRTITSRPRRQAVTHPQVSAPGESPRNPLPLPLTAPNIGVAFGRMEENITLRIMLGPKPATGAVRLQLGFSADTPPLDPAAMTVRINRTICAPCSEPPVPTTDAPPGEVARVLLYEAPLDALQDDINLVEFVPPQVPGALVWAEFIVDPEAGGARN
ncbi:MAG: hypothetical protein HQ523_04395 [Lentisphaerae bacterium]|nr:hypothetical protein [Lentisphaerota bacterium]